MQLILVVFFGALFGFLYSANTDGFIFDKNICLFAGITLIMPSLFKFKLQDIALVWSYKLILLKGFAVNYLFLPIIALLIGLITHDFGIAAGIFLLSVLSGGGMVMHWIKRSGGDTSFGFLLLFINLVFVSFSFLLLHLFGKYTADYFGIQYYKEMTLSRFAEPVITLLVIIPFLASRVIRFINPLLSFIETYRPFISRASIFIIVFYLFGLQSSQQLIEIYELEPELFAIAFAAVMIFYFLTLFISKMMFDLSSTQENAAFWQSVTRYITLALVLSTFTASTFGASMLLPIMFAYLIQIPLSVIISQRYIGRE